MRRWLRYFGFPLLILADVVASASATASAAVPTSIPDYALRAAAVYRLEVGESPMTT
ncbi:MAG TPA: hypothetical protein VFL77_01120 [Solirubrobacterales bacterium]|nr:hypothetical protein [Solirubrobacterales bacterium]